MTDINEVTEFVESQIERMDAQAWLIVAAVVAVMVAEPIATGEITPVVDTVTNSGWSLNQVMDLSTALAGETVVWRAAVDPPR